MKYLCIVVHGDEELAATLAEHAAADWRLHTVTYLGLRGVLDDSLNNVHDLPHWHIVMEKGV